MCICVSTPACAHQVLQPRICIPTPCDIASSDGGCTAVTTPGPGNHYRFLLGAEALQLAFILHAAMLRGARVRADRRSRVAALSNINHDHMSILTRMYMLVSFVATDTHKALS